MRKLLLIGITLAFFAALAIIVISALSGGMQPGEESINVTRDGGVDVPAAAAAAAMGQSPGTVEETGAPATRPIIDRGEFAAAMAGPAAATPGIDVTGIVNYMKEFNRNAMDGLAIPDYDIEHDPASGVYRVIGGGYTLSIVLGEDGGVLFATPDSGMGHNGERLVPSSLLNAIGGGSRGHMGLKGEIIRRDLDMRIYLSGIKAASAGFWASRVSPDLEQMPLPALPAQRHFTPDNLGAVHVEPFTLPAMDGYGFGVWQSGFQENLIEADGEANHNRMLYG